MSDNNKNRYWVRRRLPGNIVDTEGFLPIEEVRESDWIRFSHPSEVGIVQVTERVNGDLKIQGMPHYNGGSAPTYTFPVKNLESDPQGHARDITAGRARQNLGTPGHVTKQYLGNKSKA